MIKTLRTYLIITCMVLFAGMSYAQVSVATFEADDSDFCNLNAWMMVDCDTVANPTVDAVNGSENCMKYTRSHQYNSAIVYGEFSKPIVLADLPEISFQLMSTTATSLPVVIGLYDIFGTKITDGTVATPASMTAWQDYTIDFSQNIHSSAFQYIASIEMKIDYGNEVPSPMNDVYIDNILFTGEKQSLASDDVFTLYEEATNNNFWDAVVQGTIGTVELYTNKLMVGGFDHYNVDEMVRCVYFSNGGNHFAIELASAASEVDYSFLNIHQDVAGKNDIEFSYDVLWKELPAGGASALPTIEYMVDGGDWTAIAANETVDASAAFTNVKYSIGSTGGVNMTVRMTNNEDKGVYIDNLKMQSKMTFAESVEITGDATIEADSGSVQLAATVLPATAGQDVYWYISASPDTASISQEGLFTARSTGNYEVTAIAVDKQGAAISTYAIAVGDVTNVSELLVEDVQIYPNPVQDVLRISNINQTATLKVYALTGQLVMKMNVDVSTAQLDVSGLQTGVYILETNQNGQIQTKRFVKR